jgi:hypothetical protein
MARKATPPRGKGKALVPPIGTGKGKAAVPPLKGAAAAPPRPVRGRVVTVPVLPIGPPRRPPGRGMPPRLMPPGAARAPLAPETPRAERLEPPPPPSSRAAVMRQRGAPQTMAALRRGKVAF